MPVSITSLVRLLVVMVIAANAVAIAVSRLDPPPPVERYLAPAEQAAVNGYLLRPRTSAPMLIDAVTTRTIAVEAADGNRLDHLSLSPFRDAQGRRQMIGRWSVRRGRSSEMLNEGNGLARLSYPDGAVIDEIRSELVPFAPPAWFPGTAARVLFVAGDGQLYRYSFERGAGESGHDPEPQRVDWACTPPGGHPVLLMDVTWPTEPALHDRLIVTLARYESDGVRRGFGLCEIWWLKVDSEANAILDAGPLLEPDSSSPKSAVRSPTVAAGPDGRPMIAYLSKSRAGGPWDLRAAPLEIDTAVGAPKARHADSRLLVSRSAPTPPAISADGRWVATLQQENNGVRVVRARVDEPAAVADSGRP